MDLSSISAAFKSRVFLDGEMRSALEWREKAVEPEGFW